MAFALWESATVQGGIYARLLRHDSRQQPPSAVEVPATRDVMFTAIGGTGEAGNTGSDGQPGMDGIDGIAATREVDATVSPFSISWGSAKDGLNPITRILTTTYSLVQMEATAASKYIITSVGFSIQRSGCFVLKL